MDYRKAYKKYKHKYLESRRIVQRAGAEECPKCHEQAGYDSNCVEYFGVGRIDNKCAQGMRQQTPSS